MVRVEFRDRIEYIVDGKLHRCDGPAIIWKNSGAGSWYLFGREHRYYGTAISDNVWLIHGGFIL